MLSLADWHRLSPALFTRLETRGGAPAAVMTALERAYLANTARMLFIRSTVERIVATLSEVGVPSLLLKGTALIETVYDDPAHREMLDIDLLVPDGCHETAREALAPAGYRPVAAEGAADSPATRLDLAHLHDPVLVGSEQLTAVELHHHIATAREGSHFTVDGFWERSRINAETGHGLPSPEDLLLHVCFHFTRNRLGGQARNRNTGGALAQMLDISRLVEKETIDWDSLARTARAYRVSKRVFLGLFAGSELGVPVPGEALASIEPVGFDRELGRRLVALRVLRADDHLPVRSLRWMFAPGREVLSRGWNADPTATLSLARAYLRRAKAHVPAARESLRRPGDLLADRRLDREIEALRERG
jgi:hypothetical protein